MDIPGSGGLSIDSDHHHLHSQHFFLTTPYRPTPLRNTFHRPKFVMDSTSVGIGDDVKPRMVNEMDFFNRDVKKEETTHEMVPSKSSFDVNTGLNLLTASTSSEQSAVDDGGLGRIEDKRNKIELAVLQAELERLNEENQGLKGMLNQVSNNYNTLQLHLVTLMQQQNQNQKTENEMSDAKVEEKKHEGGEELVVPRQFMDLGLATTAETDEISRSSSDGRSGNRSKSPPNMEVVSNASNNEIVPFDQDGRGVSREDSPPDHGSQGWVPNKAQKMNVSKTVDQSTAEATMRKARVSVRARSEAPMITDGCQWRKYGQKMAKGNPCPRAYYRCTMAAGCPVRKQVQRCAEDRTILVTTYEGNHNHPLPPAAMAMASTTSAAASVLLSGSMSSADGIMNSNYLTRTMLPCSSSMATISASAPFPTVTLDLTNSPNSNPMQLQRPPTQFHLPFMTPPQNFNDSTPQSLAHLFGQSLYNQSKFSGLQVSQNVDSAQAQFPQHASAPQQPQQGQQQPSLADTVSAATAAITADPNFTAALAAAISSIIGGAHQANNNNDGNGNNSNSKQ